MQPGLRWLCGARQARAPLVAQAAPTAPQGSEPLTREPHKCEGWEWRPWPDCPQPAFLPLAQLLEAAQRGEVVL